MHAQIYKEILIAHQSLSQSDSGITIWPVR